MRRYIILLSLLFMAVYTPASPENSIQAEVIPNEVSPGDAFLIRVCDESQKQALPLYASLRGRIFHFSKASDNCFIAIGAIDLNTTSGTYTIKLMDGEKKTSLRLRLFVKHIRFPIAELTLPPDKVFLSPKDMKRAAKEEGMLSAIWQKVSDRMWERGFALPLENEVSASFGLKRIINKKKISVHKGLDMRGKEGDEVRASSSGRVVLAEELFFGGNTAIIDHGMGIYTIYMHLAGFNAKPGDIVSGADVIGFVGKTGRASGPHLHFGAKVLSLSVNPMSIIGLQP